MNAAELHDFLQQTQEPQGYFFNQDQDKVMALLAGLLENKRRYGYLGCPCRLLCGDREWDQDIICPCIYREADVRDYGSCYCGLYVSAAGSTGDRPPEYVPERRPVEKILGPPL